MNPGSPALRPEPLGKTRSAIVDLFPGSSQVSEVGLSRAADREVWAYAARHDFVIVSKDADFHQMSFVLDTPPKVVWIRVGNCSTRQALDLLRRRNADIESFVAGEGAFLAIG